MRRNFHNRLCKFRLKLPHTPLKRVQQILAPSRILGKAIPRRERSYHDVHGITYQPIMFSPDSPPPC